MMKRRSLKLEGAWNVRDLGSLSASGGRRVVPKLVYRSDDLHHLTEKDLRMLEQRGLRTVVDFRAEAEAKNAPNRLPASVRSVHALSIDPGNLLALNAIDDPTSSVMVEMNRMLVRKARAQYAAFLSLLQDRDNLPLLFHCSAGKDRTGLGAALFLSALGVDREVIYQDYLLSARRARLRYRELLAQKPELAPLLTVKRSYLAGAFDALDAEYGGVERYLADVLDAHPRALRTIYTSEEC